MLFFQISFHFILNSWSFFIKFIMFYSNPPLFNKIYVKFVSSPNAVLSSNSLISFSAAASFLADTVLPLPSPRRAPFPHIIRWLLQPLSLPPPFCLVIKMLSKLFLRVAVDIRLVFGRFSTSRYFFPPLDLLFFRIPGDFCWFNVFSSYQMLVNFVTEFVELSRLVFIVGILPKGSL